MLLKATTSLCLGVSLIVMGLSSSAQASVVSVNFLGNLNTGESAVPGSYGVVTEGANVGNWNNVLYNASDGSSVSNVLDSSNIASTVDVETTDIVTNYSYSSTYDNTPLRGGPGDGTGSLKSTITISDIDGFASSYNLIVYLAGPPTGVRASITDGTTTYYYETVSVADVTLVEVTDTNPGDGHQVGNYVVFRGLTASSIVLTNDANSGLFGGPSGSSGVGGFQIVPVVPEPGSAALIGVGSLMLLFRKKK